MDPADAVKVGSRKSELALIQTRHVIGLMKELYPSTNFEIVTMTTMGDRILNISLPKIGEKSLFTKDLEEALENGSVDMVVHSLKDLPTTLPDGMAIGAVLDREDPRDALVLREDLKGYNLSTLPMGSIIGTSSLRRTAQLSRMYPHLKVVDIRGNLNTRLRKLDYHCNINNKQNDTSQIQEIPEYSALILAQAGLVRMGWQHRISEVLPSESVLYAVGQGALAIECRANNDQILKMLAPLNHDITYCRILSERSFLKTLGGGCSAPVAISTTFECDPSLSSRMLEINGAVWSLDGKIKIQDSIKHIFDSVNLSSINTCPIKPQSAKAKPIKHKLQNENIVNDNDNCKKLCLENADKPTPNRKEMPCCRRESISMTMENAEPVEMENLINIHGKLFWSCPFSDKKGGVCPVRLPIGGDFMGKCPYTDEALSSNGNIEDVLVKLHPRRSTYDIKKCPFMSNQIVAIDAQLGMNSLIDDKILPEYNIENEPKAKNCPFLKRNVEEVQIDLNANGNENKEENHSVSEEKSKVKLYCGLTKHFDIPEGIIVKCEEMGKQLAQSLISNGALEVMKCAQDHIRGSVPIKLPIVSNA